MRLSASIARPVGAARPFRPYRAVYAAALSALLLGGCAIAPEPMSTAEHVERARGDYAKLFTNQTPVTAPVTLEDAIARAILYNYDTRLAMVEASLQDRQFDLALMNMLPRLAADAGYTWRNNENASSSVSVLTRRQSLEPSTSQDQDRFTSDLSFSWNILDFGVSYFQARQQADRALIAVERRRRVVNTIVKEVRAAYWRAVTAQRLLPRLEPLLADARQALVNSEEIERQQLQPLMQTLEYRKNLLQVIGQLRRLQSDLSIAKTQLGALISIPPGTPFEIAAADDLPPPPKALSAPLDKLEVLALARRPELREEAYQERIDRNNVYKEITRMMPGVTLLGSLNFDSNSYLYNNSWAETGVRATFNLVNLISGPKAIDVAETQIDVTRMRRLALSVAVLTQVNVGYQQFQRAIENYDAAREVSLVEDRIMKAVNDGGTAQTVPEFERIRRALSAISAELDRDRSFTELQASLSNVYSSIGLDPVPASVEGNDLDGLRAEVARALQQLDQGVLPPLPELDEAPRPAPVPAS